MLFLFVMQKFKPILRVTNEVRGRQQVDQVPPTSIRTVALLIGISLFPYFAID